jgi:D-arabinose 5-phosphate isomerase GutQ
VALAMGDALAVALLEKRGFKEQDLQSFILAERLDVDCW